MKEIEEIDRIVFETTEVKLPASTRRLIKELAQTDNDPYQDLRATNNAGAGLSDSFKHASQLYQEEDSYINPDNVSKINNSYEVHQLPQKESVVSKLSLNNPYNSNKKMSVIAKYDAINSSNVLMDGHESFRSQIIDQSLYEQQELEETVVELSQINEYGMSPEQSELVKPRPMRAQQHHVDFSFAGAGGANYQDESKQGDSYRSSKRSSVATSNPSMPSKQTPKLPAITMSVDSSSTNHLPVPSKRTRNIPGLTQHNTTSAGAGQANF
jgi:hypothetical protein